MWRATRTPDGPATTEVTATLRAGHGGASPASAAARAEGPRATGVTVTMRAWGPGAQWCLDGLTTLIGEEPPALDRFGESNLYEPASETSRTEFLRSTEVIADLQRRFPGVRLCATGAVMEALIPSILEQKVIGQEAWRSYAALVRRLGQPAPGPLPPEAAGLMVPPSPAVLGGTPTWVFHRCNVERKRADTVRMAAGYSLRLEEIGGLTRPEAYSRLTALPGIGPWTAAEVARMALGDGDAVSVGDYHLPNRVAWALAAEARADDARMLELLEPWRGWRASVIRLIEVGAPGPPRFGPRLAVAPITDI